MFTNMKKFFLYALSVAVLAGCANDFTAEIEALPQQTLTITAEADDTRIQLMEGKTVWNEDDVVSVFYMTNGNEIWRCLEPTGARKAHLVNKYDNDGKKAIDDIIVYYPWMSENAVNDAGTHVSSTLSDTQSYLADSYGIGSSPMVGVAEQVGDDNMSGLLRSVCGWLKLSLTGTAHVGRIVVKGNNGEILAGKISVEAATAALEFDSSATTQAVALKCPGYVQLSATATDFYIALPPVTFTKGITVDIYDSEGKMMSKSTASELVIERNAIQPMAELAVVCDTAVKKSVTVTQKTQSFNSITVDVVTEGYPSYIIGVLGKTTNVGLSDSEEAASIKENLKKSFEEWNVGNGVFGKEVSNATYSGELLGFGEAYYPSLYPENTYVLYILPLEDGKSRGEEGTAGDYTFDDVFTWTFTTDAITSGGTAKLTMEAAETGYNFVDVAITGDDNTAMIYAMPLTEEEFRKVPFEQSKLNKLFATCKETPDPLIQNGNKHSIMLSGYEPGTSGYVMALAVDKNGKYGSVVYQKFTTKTIEYSTTMSVAIDDVKAEWTSASVKVNVTGGTAVSYNYFCMTTSTYKYRNYTQEQMQKEMILKTSANFYSVSASDLVDGAIKINGLNLNYEYTFGVMAVDAQGTPTNAVVTTFTPTVPEYTFITADDPRHAQTKPTFRYTMDYDTYYNSFRVNISVEPTDAIATYYVGCYNSALTGKEAFEYMVTNAGPYEASRVRFFTEATTLEKTQIYSADACVWISWIDKDGNCYECISDPIIKAEYVPSTDAQWATMKPTVQMSIDANSVLNYTVTPSTSAVNVYIAAYSGNRYVDKNETYIMTLKPSTIKTNNQPYSGTLEGAQSNATVVVTWTDKSGNLYEAAKFSLE